MTAGGEHDRGRDLVGTGRGGAGNAVRSPSRGRPVESAEEHKAAMEYQQSQPTAHAGRGGAGNIRSPSRDPIDHKAAYEEEKREHQIQADAIKADAAHPHHAGRGGAGNIRTDSKDRDDRGRGGVMGAIRNFSRSRSRDTSKTPPHHDTNHHPHGDSKLRPVDESSTTSTLYSEDVSTHPETKPNTIAEKIVNLLPTSTNNKA